MDYRGDPATEYLCHVSYKKARFRKAITTRSRNSAARCRDETRGLRFRLSFSLTEGTTYRNDARQMDS